MPQTEERQQMKTEPKRCTARGNLVKNTRTGAPTDEKLPDGQLKDHYVLCPEDRAKGYVEPYRDSYIHEKCGVLTRMPHACADHLAAKPPLPPRIVKMLKRLCSVGSIRRSLTRSQPDAVFKVQMNVRRFLCYAFGEGDRWTAICVDLDLIVEARTQRAVIERLNQTISSYLEDALKEEPRTCAQLLNRSSPWWLRLSLWAQYHYYMARRSKPHSKSFSAIAVPCPALS